MCSTNVLAIAAQELHAGEPVCALLPWKRCCPAWHCCRPDGEVVSGWASMRGKRPLNEDTVYCQWHNEQGVDVGAFGVFDG